MPEFFEGLNSLDANYVVIRRFEALPVLRSGEDIDLLVSDKNLHVVESRLRSYRPFRPTQKVNLYTESGLPGTDFRGVAYFSRKLATRMLADAVFLRDKYRVPNPVDHLDSMAFHAVYHKGYGSGLASEVGDPTKSSLGTFDLDYGSVLTELARRVARNVDISLVGLDEYLGDQGLRPSICTLEMLQTENQWLQNRLSETRLDIGSLADLIVFVVRDEALRFRDEIVSLIGACGLEILEVLEPDASQKERLTEVVRGGNWGRGQFPESGGGPACLIFAYDFGHCSDDLMVTGNHESSARVAGAKVAVRRLVARRIPGAERFNPIHSSANGWQSIEYAEALGDSQRIDRLSQKIAEIDHAMSFPWPVERSVANGRRSRTAVVVHPTYGTVFAKIFRPGAEQSLESEVFARVQLGDLELVPPLLERGDNYLLTPLYVDTRAHARRRLPGRAQVQLTADAVQKLSVFVTVMRDRGLYLLDLTNPNMISDESHGLKFVDFEFLQEYSSGLPAIEKDHTVVGVGYDNNTHRPASSLGEHWTEVVGRTIFHPAISGLPRGQILTDHPSWIRRLQMTVRTQVWYAIWMGRVFFGKNARSYVRLKFQRQARRCGVR